VVKGKTPLLGTVADHIAGEYEKHLFGGKTLQDLPDDLPRFVINATSLQSGVLWRFSKPYMGDWKVGRFAKPRVKLALAVAASSAFPPFLSPAEVEPDCADYINDPAKPPVLTDPKFRAKAVLTDGGVYDNLGLETAYKRYDTLLVSDGGGAWNRKARRTPSGRFRLIVC
jgi:NTE family protein